MRTPSSLTRLALCGAAGLFVSIASPAMAQNEFLDRATALGAATPGTIHAEEILFPVLAEMDAPPADVSTGSALDAMLMLQPGDAEWSRFERWARKDAQQAVLEALKEITDPEAKKAHVFDIPFGRDGTDILNEDAGLWIEVPTDGMVASARYHYLDKIEWINALALFEGMRLASEGEGEPALDTMVDLLRFGRILAERPSVTEVKAAYTMMRLASERTRDMVYTHAASFESDDLVEAGEAFDERNLRPRLMPMPEVERVAALQLLGETFTERGAVKEGEFARIFALLEAEDRPLRRLSEAARYREQAGNQGDWFDQYDWIEKVWGDYSARWRVPGYRDKLFERSTQFEQLDKNAMALVGYAAQDMKDLMGMRNAMELDLGGTMNALGVVAFEKTEGKLPPKISSIEPTYTNRLKKDTFNFNSRYEGNVFFDMNYWVPIRDQEFDRRVQPHPYEIEVVLPKEGESMFVAEAPKGGSADAVLRSLSLKQPGIQRLIGRPAPEVALTNWHNSDAPITFASSTGDIRVVIFWATWCGPCKASIPGNNAVYAKYKDQGVTFMGICDNKRGGNSMASTADQHSMAYPTGLDSDGSATSNFALPHWPYVLIVDRAGVVRGAGIEPGDLEKAVSALVAEQPQGWTGGDAGGADLASGEPIVDLGAFMALTEDERNTMTNRELFALMGIDAPDVFDPVMDMSYLETESLSDAELQNLIGMTHEESEAFFEEFFMNLAMNAGAPAAVNSFNVLLDDSQFLLYSTGPDGMDNQAKKVGAGGDDVLFWPPLMSLTRKHLHGEF